MYAIQTVVLSSVVVGHLSFYAYLGTKIMKSVSRGLELDSLDPSDTIQAAQTRVRIEILRSRGKEQWFSKRSRRWRWRSQPAWRNTRTAHISSTLWTSSEKSSTLSNSLRILESLHLFKRTSSTRVFSPPRDRWTSWIRRWIAQISVRLELHRTRTINDTLGRRRSQLWSGWTCKVLSI